MISFEARSPKKLNIKYQKNPQESNAATKLIQRWYWTRSKRSDTYLLNITLCEFAYTFPIQITSTFIVWSELTVLHLHSSELVSKWLVSALGASKVEWSRLTFEFVMVVWNSIISWHFYSYHLSRNIYVKLRNGEPWHYFLVFFYNFSTPLVSFLKTCNKQIGLA